MAYKVSNQGVLKICVDLEDTYNWFLKEFTPLMESGDKRDALFLSDEFYRNGYEGLKDKDKDVLIEITSILEILKKEINYSYVLLFISDI